MKLDEQHSYVALSLSFVLAAVMLLAGSLSYSTATALAFGSMCGTFLGVGIWKVRWPGWQSQINRRLIIDLIVAGFVASNVYLILAGFHDLSLIEWLMSGLANTAGCLAGWLLFWAIFWKAGPGPKW